jgi:predicted ATPase/class 3 adenylate cyclase
VPHGSASGLLRHKIPVYPGWVSQSVRIPTGTVTLLFTDIEGSTRLWEAEPDQMAEALRRHDEILRAAIGRADGYVFKTVGDAFCAAFWTAQAALDAALSAQRRLVAEDWPTSRPVLVRMALHSGVCEERDNDYFGPVVNRAARLEAIAHGGQLLASGATAELLMESLPDGVGLRDLGHHRLKDLGRPELVYQVEAGYLPASFAPLTSLDNPELPNNLPSLLSAFIGRDRELDEVRTLARSSRLLTLTGAGGSGKTRLALQAAAEMIDGTADGVWLVELATVPSGDKVPHAVSAVLGLTGQVGDSAADALIDALDCQDVLILLDNCEHVIDAAAKFCDALMRHCPRIRLIATSREPLGIDGERVYRVPSLSLPPAEAETASDLAEFDAVRLFADRAKAHDPEFVLSETTGAPVATICRCLDGIPLALELAAARLSSMSLQQICERLDQRFRLLTGGSRSAMPRQQTLQATVDWSFSLLTSAERETVARLSVFRGGFELEAAEAVCSAGAVDALEVMDLVHSLVSKSLVVADRTPSAVRYRMLETIRQYSAAELVRLAGDGGLLRIRDRHADYYLQLAEKARPELTGRRQGEWLRQLDVEWDNLRSAAARLEAAGRPYDVVRLVVALERFIMSRLHTDLIGYLRRAIDNSAAAPSPLLARALITGSRLVSLGYRRDPAELAIAAAYGERALAMARELGDRRIEARALNVRGDVAARDRDEVRRLAEEAVAIAREIGDVQLLGEQLRQLAAISTGEEASSVGHEALACCQQSGDELIAAVMLQQLYGQELRAGLIEEASSCLERSLAIAERLGSDMFMYTVRSDLSVLRLIQGRHEDALPVLRWCLMVARRVGTRIDASELLLAAACCAAWQGDQLRAARLHGAADADIAAAVKIGAIGMTAPEQDLRERAQARLRAELGDAAYERAYAAGATLSSVEAVELALSREVPASATANSV